MMSNRLRALLPVLLSLVVCACTTQPVVVRTGTPDDAIWSMNGRLGISSGTRHGTFTVDWRQHKDDYAIDLLGPMGVGVARITRNAGTVTLQVPNKPPMVAYSANELLVKSMGLDIPVTPLRYWVRGKPAPGNWRRTDSGFEQMGWNVSYLRYVSGLPVKIKLSRPEVRMTMVVRKWTD